MPTDSIINPSTKATPATGSRKRIVWLDWARAAAICTVVLCHATEATYPFSIEGMASIGTASQLAAFALFTIGRLGVPLFLFISGYLLLNRHYDKAGCIRFWKTKWCSLVAVTEIWIVIYMLYLIAFKHADIGPADAVKYLLFLEKVPLGHMWYMPMIIGLYLFIPIIANGLKALDDYKVLRFPLAIAFFLFLVIPMLSTVSKTFGHDAFSTIINDGFEGGAFGLYMLLGYCVKKGMFKTRSLPQLAFIAVGSFAIAILMQWLAFDHGAKAQIWYTNCFLLITGLAIFLIFSHGKKLKETRLIAWLSTYAFAIYLVHFPIKQIITPWVQGLDLPTTALETIALGVLVLAISLIISMAIAKIPVIGKRLLYLK